MNFFKELMARCTFLLFILVAFLDDDVEAARVSITLKSLNFAKFQIHQYLVNFVSYTNKLYWCICLACW